MKYKKLFSLIFIIFSFIILTSIIYSYTDYGIQEIDSKTSILSSQDFNFTVTISNNTDTAETINFDANIYSPNNSPIASGSFSCSVQDNSIEKCTKSISNTTDFQPSTQSYKVIIEITDADDNNQNNKLTQYFSIRRDSSKVPVSDTPTFLAVGFVLGFALYFSSSIKSKKE